MKNKVKNLERTWIIPLFVMILCYWGGMTYSSASNQSYDISGKCYELE